MFEIVFSYEIDTPLCILTSCRGICVVHCVEEFLEWDLQESQISSPQSLHTCQVERFFFIICMLTCFFNHLIQETYGGTSRSDRKPMMVSYQFECQHQTFDSSQYPQPQSLIGCLENEVISVCVWCDNNLIKMCCFICFAKHQLHDLLLILPVNFPSPSFWGLFHQIFWLTLQPATVPHCTLYCIS